jgi:hypothetical protein
LISLVVLEDVPLTDFPILLDFEDYVAADVCGAQPAQYVASQGQSVFIQGQGQPVVVQGQPLTVQGHPVMNGQQSVRPQNFE